MSTHAVTRTRLERGEQLYPRTVADIRFALEAADVEFFAENGGCPGARLKSSKPPLIRAIDDWRPGATGRRPDPPLSLPMVRSDRPQAWVSGYCRAIPGSVSGDPHPASDGTTAASVMALVSTRDQHAWRSLQWRKALFWLQNRADPVPLCPRQIRAFGAFWPMRTGSRVVACYRVTMTTSENLAAASFTSPEREYIRRELDQFFGTFPSVADGFQLKTWRGGPQKGQPKLPPARQGADRAGSDAA